MMSRMSLREMEKVRHIERYTQGKFQATELNITYKAHWGREAIEARLASLCAQAEDAVRAGTSIIILSDRKVGPDRVAVPALLAVSAIHQHLVGKGLRTSTGLVVETGSAREVHHFALLGAFGAEAVHPYLALETLLELAAQGKLGSPLTQPLRLLCFGYDPASGTYTLLVKRLVRAGGVLTLALAGGVQVVQVLAPGLRRGPASEARTLYRMLDDAGA